MTEAKHIPIDQHSHAALAAKDLELQLVDTSDSAAVTAWLLADARGFHDADPSAEFLATRARELGASGDRVTGVFDRSLPETTLPVATIWSWEMGLTVPGGNTLSAWAISSVTVAPTHRRKGIARALLTSELRTAQAAGSAMAMLTVTEATIYGRYGFGPAAWQAPYSIDTRGLRWIGPVPEGRVSFITPGDLLSIAPEVFDRARTRVPGETDRRDDTWKRILGLAQSAPNDDKRDLRAVAYRDADQSVQGFAVYRFEGHEEKSMLALIDLIAATDDAYSALWRYLIEMDLVREISAPRRNVAEAVIWQVNNPRAIRKTDQRDQLWLRILDVQRVLAARTYAAPGIFVLTVHDELGFADGEYVLEVAPTGHGTVSLLKHSTVHLQADAATVTLSVNDLASLYLGGASAVALARSGRLDGLSPNAAEALDRSFTSADSPHLSTWF